MAVLGGLGHAATVAQLVGVDVGGLITMIIQAAATARRNKMECELLARRVLMINDLLLHLQDPETMVKEPEVRQPLAGLDRTLRQAHGLVTHCQRRNAVYRFFMAGRLADRFRDVHSMIDSYLILFPFISHIDITRRLNQQMRDTVRVPSDHTTTAPSSPSPSANIARKVSYGVQEFTFQELVDATENFAVAREIGRGGFSRVCVGRLADGREVVVKRKSVVTKSEEEFMAEVTVLSQLRHKHIIRLLGWCVEDAEEDDDEEEQERLLVIEHVENGSLYDHLHGQLPPWSSSPVRESWKARIEILLGVSRAIDYLHNSTEPPVIHRDIKPSNILLDASWSPRLSDFGAAVSCWDDASIADLTPRGTPGYVDPQYSSTGVLKPTSDVYNFGVVMLEVLTGKKPIFSLEDVHGKGNGAMNPSSLTSFALPIIEAGKVSKLLDRRPALKPTLREIQAMEMVARTAARCVRLKGEDRPAMSDVVAKLQEALELVRT
ncbi:putative serine/threonine-protein kinase-like protein CCR3 [Oryza brachyantha]|nr:putative serine/threonine-protein kinase-like protein CCR3 [Oryza brachyantha]